MKGKYHVIVQNKRLRYEFDIKRNITIIRGGQRHGKNNVVLHDRVSSPAWRQFGGGGTV